MTQIEMLNNAGYQHINGVCLELSRRWVASRLQGVSFQQTMDLIENPEFVDGVVAAQTARPEDRFVDGLNNETKASRHGMPGIFSVWGLVSRKDVIRHVLNHRGVYIYTFSSYTSGHAMAFDSRDPNSFYFFDANQGGWTISNEANDMIKGWWWSFWDNTGEGYESGAINYKAHYRNGTRKLTRYTVLPMN